MLWQLFPVKKYVHTKLQNYASLKLSKIMVPCILRLPNLHGVFYVMAEPMHRYIVPLIHL